jgi:hypothetical protein
VKIIEDNPRVDFVLEWQREEDTDIIAGWYIVQGAHGNVKRIYCCWPHDLFRKTKLDGMSPCLFDTVGMTYDIESYIKVLSCKGIPSWASMMEDLQDDTNDSGEG